MDTLCLLFNGGMNSWPIGCQTHLHDSSREAILVFIWVYYVKTNLHKNTVNPNSLVWYLVEWMQLRLWNRFFWNFLWVSSVTSTIKFDYTEPLWVIFYFEKSWNMFITYQKGWNLTGLDLNILPRTVACWAAKTWRGWTCSWQTSDNRGCVT